MHGILAHQEYLAAATERARAGNNVLIHSLSEARELIFDVIERIGARSVCEIGSEGGLMSQELYRRYSIGSLERLTVIDPAPTPEVRALADDKGCNILAEPSLAALPSLPAHDVYIVDGDHNFYTVYNELQLILRNPDALVILHDISWPCAYRDQYYNAAGLPGSALNDPSEKSIHPSSPDLVRHGFNGAGVFQIASKEGGPNNGVFRAIEVIADEFEVEFSSVPALFGIGFLRGKNYPQSQTLLEVLNFSAIEPLLFRLEENRLTTYLRVIELEAQLHERNVHLDRIRRGRLSFFEFTKIVGRFVLGGFLSKGRQSC